MNSEELRNAVRSAAYEILKTEVAIAPVDLFIKIGILTKKDYEDWRMGRVAYLEKVCIANLNKLTVALDELRKYAQENNLKSSKTVYMKWGKGRKTQLRFSKTNNSRIEETYSTHFVNTEKAASLKKSRTEKENHNQSPTVTDICEIPRGHAKVSL